MKKICILSGILFVYGVIAAPEVPKDFRFNRLPTYYTGKILPEPKEVVYSGKFLKLDRTVIVPPETIALDDLRLRFLRDRIEMNGARVEIVRQVPADCTAVIRPVIGKEAPEHSEGYSIDFREPNEIVVTGHDAQGVLWGMVSLAQMIRKDEAGVQMQIVKVRDYPDVARRGFLCYYWPKIVPEFVLFNKINTVVFQMAHYDTGKGGQERFFSWRYIGERPAPEKDASMREYGAVAAGLGLDFRYSLHIVSTELKKQFRCSSEEDYQKLLVSAETLAENRLGLYLGMDDHRFPVHPDDLKKFGSGRQADIYLVNRLYRELKQKYPDFRMVWCQPFYLGPTSPQAKPEDRTEYLTAVGQEVDPEIDIFWTGPRVKFTPPTPEMTKWYTDLIRRSPWTFVNGKPISHMHFYCYVTDPISWWKSETYPSFWQEDMKAALINTGGRNDAVSTATFGNYMWNQQGYRPEECVRSLVAMFFGPDAFPALDNLNEKMSYFDKYMWKVSAGAVQRLPEIREKLKELETAYGEAEKVCKFGLENLSIFPLSLVNTHKFVKRLSSNINLSQFAEAEEKVRAEAEKEVGLSKEDILLGAGSFFGGKGPAVYGIRGCPKRLANWIHGSRSPFGSMSANFTCEPFPVSGDFKLIISGQDDDSKIPSEIEIKVNDRVIFSGANGFVKLNWSRREFTIPEDCLQRQNKLTVSSLSPSANIEGPPFFMISYAVLKPQAD